MLNPYRKEEIFSILQGSVVEVLGCNLEDVENDTAIVNDLGADSLDFVELTYRLEKKLNITLPKKSVLEHVADKIGKEKVFSEEMEISEGGLFFLENSFSRFSRSQIKAGMTSYEIVGLATVGNWVNLCYELFNYLPAFCPDCKHDTATVSPSKKILCVSCGAAIKPISGDQALSQYTTVLIERWEQERNCVEAVEIEG